jgi:hypothetical protein
VERETRAIPTATIAAFRGGAIPQDRTVSAMFCVHANLARPVGRCKKQRPNVKVTSYPVALGRCGRMLTATNGGSRAGSEVGMSDSVRDPADERARRHRRRWMGAMLGVLGTIAVFAVVVGVGFVVGHVREARPLPTFPSLAEHPDPSLQGTVAYYADDTRCIRLVASAGTPSRNLWCLPPEGPSTWETTGKPVGPQLVWRPDGRLEITMFRMKPTKDTKSAPPLTRGWQKIIDVHNRAVEDVPTAEVPESPNLSTQPTVNAQGEQLRMNFDAATGKAEVTLTTRSGTRALLSVHGPGEYTYQFGPVFWAPNGNWIAATDDGRILIIDPRDPATTRILVTGTGGGAGGGTAGPTFAVTSENILTPSS